MVDDSQHPRGAKTNDWGQDPYSLADTLMHSGGNRLDLVQR